MRVLLNCAVDARGRLAGPQGEQVRISSDADMRRVHRLRAEVDAILVGVQTAIADNPSLRVKAEYADGPDPRPIVLDSTLRLPRAAKLAGRKDAIVYHTGDMVTDLAARTVRVAAGDGGVDLEAVLRHMEGCGIASVLVEGGSKVLASFVKSGLWTQWTIFQSNADLGDGPALWGGLPDVPQAGMKLLSRKETMGGVLWTFVPSR